MNERPPRPRSFTAEWAEEHARIVDVAAGIAALPDARPGRHVDARLMEVLAFADGPLMAHLRSEHRRLIPAIERVHGAIAEELVEDVLVDQAVLRNAIIALKHAIGTMQDHRRALGALQAGLEAHAKLFDQRVQTFASEFIAPAAWSHHGHADELEAEL